MSRPRSDKASESDRRSQAYDQGIGDRLPRGRRRRRRYVTAGTQDQLQIRLQNPPWCNVCFVGDFEHRLVIADRALDAGELNLVLVQAAGIADPSKACPNPQNIELAARQETLEGKAGIDLEGDQIAIGRRVADAQKGCETLARRIGATPQHLIQYKIRSEIAAMRGGDTVAGGIRERASQAIAAQIGKIRRMVPGAEFDIAQSSRRDRLFIESVRKLGNRKETTLTDKEINAARVADLRITRSRRRRIAVEGRCRYGQTADRRHPKSRPRCCERVTGPAARQIGRPNVRTAECRVDEACRVLADVKFVIESDLTDAEGGLAIEELLLQPQIMKTRRGQRLDTADCQQVADRVLRQAPPADLIPVYVKTRSGPFSQLLEIECKR